MFLLGIPFWLIIGVLVVLGGHYLYASVFNVWHYFAITATFTGLALVAHAIWVYTNKRWGPQAPSK